jgi:hypothetical protein
LTTLIQPSRRREIWIGLAARSSSDPIGAARALVTIFVDLMR